MLAKKRRLTKQQFDTFFKTGKRHHTPTLQLIYAPNKQFSGAAVVGKKVLKRAVDRNKMRRQLYGALYRAHLNDGLAGVYILIAKPAAKSVGRRELIDEAKLLLDKVT